MSGRIGPKDWSPEFRPPTTRNGVDLLQYVRGVVIVGGEGDIDLGGKGPVYVAVVHDGGGYVPAAAIAVDQNQYHNLSNDVLETAYEIMTEREMENVKHVKELQEEWGDRWDEILTEAFDGKVWVFESPLEAARALRVDKRAREFITITMPDRS